MHKILLLAIPILFLKCSLKNNKAYNIANTKELKVKEEYIVRLPEKIDLAFGIHQLELDSGSYILCLDAAKRLYLENPISKDSFSIDFRKYAGGIRLYAGDVSDSTLYFLNKDSMWLQSFRISGRRSLLEASRIRLLDHIDTSQKYVRFQNYTTFKVIYPYLYLAYGTYVPAQQYLDRYAYLKVNLNAQSKIAKKVCYYPSVFLEGTYDYVNTFLYGFSNGNLFYSFRSYDSIYILNSDGLAIKGRILNNNENFQKFDKKKRGDLGFARVHTLTNESNTSVAISKYSNDVFIIKKRRKEKVIEKDIFDYYVLDSALTLKYKNTFGHTVEKFFCISFKRGFLIFDQNLDKAFYYETF